MTQPILDIYPRQVKVYVHTKSYTQVFIVYICRERREGEQNQKTPCDNFLYKGLFIFYFLAKPVKI